MPKEPTRAQLSSRLTYQAQIPAFLQRMQRGAGGGRGDDDYDDEDDFEYDGSGRPPIPRRPAIPERPDDERGSADEDDVDEKPQVVVLKEGKHLTEREAENERRKAKGLSPLPEPEAEEASNNGTLEKEGTSLQAKAGKQQAPSVTMGAATKGKNAKRKAVGDGRDDANKPEPAVKGTKKKAKKQEKKLLSFDADA
ncbi:hypothetical protein L226DRAFT_54929 [Lentinus tigrinus ALCF2SS1-7]|uniref:DUF4604 domain-containing protein n=1 Tax=Lentinus tigrinus ALCF2SS1-6 TaxID=1328759 RepID=A0A5C2SB20_9APHY|nr:hypothetical protein L227DRAFT_610619 [Lentinus tigrinus ALCF2SS1-6]RPD75109.1 hypothetical protein L226DRAFT_54929 [Lentinus tigrinus ALCF2SS1-7]